MREASTTGGTRRRQGSSGSVGKRSYSAVTDAVEPPYQGEARGGGTRPRRSAKLHGRRAGASDGRSVQRRRSPTTLDSILEQPADVREDGARGAQLAGAIRAIRANPCESVLSVLSVGSVGKISIRGSPWVMSILLQNLTEQSLVMAGGPKFLQVQ